MADTLNFTLPQERFHPAFNALDLDLRSRSQPASQAKKAEETPEPDFELNIANAVWAQQGYPYLPEYLDLLAQNYGAGLRLVDFTQAPESAVGKINRWVSEETKGRIKEIVNDLKGCRLVLTNAIYFNGKWGSPFNEEHTKSEPFYLLDGQIERVPLMHQTEYFLYTEGEGYQAIALPYANSNFAMVILLPREGQYREIEKKVTSEWVQDAVRGFESQEVILTMPKYRFETPLISLKELLSSMGMADAFSDYADFSGITQQQPGLKIDYVLHKAFIEVNETKTEAAAASAVLMVEVSRGVRVPTTPPPVVMRIDHPFIFIIRDSQTNTILFVGRVMNPTQ